MPGALLVADQHMTDPVRVHQRVVRRKDAAAGDPEHGVRAGLLQRADEGLGARHVLGAGVGLPGGAGQHLREEGRGGLLHSV
ncbi:hypothetical protein EES42_16895 [Streptomyces sp. ADI95-17]|nr:hypothetical protein EES42_16895 [Streptomyces sp. ADI95-17]